MSDLYEIKMTMQSGDVIEFVAEDFQCVADVDIKGPGGLRRYEFAGLQGDAQILFVDPRRIESVLSRKIHSEEEGEDHDAE